MVFQLVFHPEAEEELIEASLWYETQQEKLGERFIQAVNETIILIQSQPELFKTVSKKYKEAVLSVFPFTIVYSINKKHKTIFIAAVYHTSRNPKNKFRKL